MKVHCLWYGGCNYAAPRLEDLETFDSLTQAKRVFDGRMTNASGQFPCVDESAEMHVYFGEYTENGPDRIIKFGPRGGLVVERV